MQTIHTRRHFLAGAAATAASCLLGQEASAAEPLETTSVRFPVYIGVSDCQTPMYIATELLRAEGFTDVRFVKTGAGPDSADWLAHGDIDFDFNFPPAHIRSIASGSDIAVLAGMHVGCLELIASDKVHNIIDLKGKRLGVDAIDGTPHILLMIIGAYVGLDPVKDFQWVSGSEPVELLAQGKIDAFLGSPPQPQIARDRKIGHVILNSAFDPPWSQNLCCMLSVSRNYLTRNPIATKRVLKCILKTVDLCASNPDAAARSLIETGFGSRPDYVRQAMSDVRYDKWREYDPEDSLRFYALRMFETGMITTNPQKIIAEGTDWRFLAELKRELKT